MHLLKSLQRLLREDEYNSKQIMEIASEIKTQAMINQLFKMLLHKCKKYAVLVEVVDEYLGKFCEDERDLGLPFKIQVIKH